MNLLTAIQSGNPTPSSQAENAAMRANLEIQRQIDIRKSRINEIRTEGTFDRKVALETTQDNLTKALANVDLCISDRKSYLSALDAAYVAVEEAKANLKSSHSEVKVLEEEIARFEEYKSFFPEGTDYSVLNEEG